MQNECSYVNYLGEMELNELLGKCWSEECMVYIW